MPSEGAKEEAKTDDINLGRCVLVGGRGRYSICRGNVDCLLLSSTFRTRDHQFVDCWDLLGICLLSPITGAKVADVWSNPALHECWDRGFSHLHGGRHFSHWDILQSHKYSSWYQCGAERNRARDPATIKLEQLVSLLGRTQNLICVVRQSKHGGKAW